MCTVTNQGNAPHPRQRLWYGGLLALIILFHAANNYYWIAQDVHSLGYDVCHHISNVITLRHEFEKIICAPDGVIKKIELTSALFINGNDGYHIYNPLWPPLVYVIATLGSFGFSDLLFGIRFLNLFYFALLIISMYLIGKRVHSATAGLLAAAFISLYPAVFGISRKFGLDFPLIAFVAFIMYALLACEEFQRRGRGILFGVALGLGMLIKGQCLYFIVGPLLYAIGRGFLTAADKRRFFLNLLLSLGIAAMISLLWWHKYLNASFLSFALKMQFTKPGGDSGAFAYYFKACILNLSPLLCGMFLTGLFWYVRAMKRKEHLMIWLWLVCPYCIFSVISFKFEQFIFPLFGAVALISVIGWLESPWNRLLRMIGIGCFLIAAILQSLVLSYTTSWSSMIDGEWCYVPYRSNDRALLNDFASVIRTQNPQGAAVAFIEEPYFRADPCMRLANFLRVSNPQCIVTLSATGAPNASVSDEFLASVGKSDFVIAYSESLRPLDFTGLILWTTASQYARVLEVRDQLRTFICVRQGVIGRGVHIFLLKRNE